jgi:gas vesicle protein
LLILVNNFNQNQITMNDNSKVLAALLAGVAAGIAMGMLFAPEKGSETRDKLNDSLRNLADSIKDRASDEINTIKSKFGNAGENMNAASATVRSTFDSAADSTETNFNQA